MALGMVVALFVWITAESFGQLFSGSASDPSSGPLLALCALAYRPARARKSEKRAEDLLMAGAV